MIFVLIIIYKIRYNRSTKRVSHAKTLVECSVFYENSKLKKKEKKEKELTNL